MKVESKMTPEVFKPIEITITLNTEQDLLTLMGCVNVNNKSIKEGLRLASLDKCVNLDNFTPSDIVPLWDLVSDHAREAGLK